MTRPISSDSIVILLTDSEDMELSLDIEELINEELIKDVNFPKTSQ